MSHRLEGDFPGWQWASFFRILDGFTGLLSPDNATRRPGGEAIRALRVGLPKGCQEKCFSLHFPAARCILILVQRNQQSTKSAFSSDLASPRQVGSNPRGDAKHLTLLNRTSYFK